MPLYQSITKIHRLILATRAQRHKEAQKDFILEIKNVTFVSPCALVSWWQRKGYKVALDASSNQWLHWIDFSGKIFLLKSELSDFCGRRRQNEKAKHFVCM